jgi:hypothetical protein
LTSLQPTCNSCSHSSSPYGWSEVARARGPISMGTAAESNCPGVIARSPGTRILSHRFVTFCPSGGSNLRRKLPMRPKSLIGVEMSKWTWNLDHDRANIVARPRTPVPRHVDSMTESRLVNSTIDRTSEGKCERLYGG